MNQPQPDEPTQWEPLKNECTVYRAVLYGDGIDKPSGKVIRGAFLRRGPDKNGKPRDTLGLSVLPFLEEKITEVEIVGRIRERISCKAIGSLQVGGIRGIEEDDPRFGKAARCQ